MAWCLTAASHYLNQCWLIISEILWQSSKGNFTRNTSITKLNLKIIYLKFYSNLRGVDELKTLDLAMEWLKPFSLQGTSGRVCCRICGRAFSAACVMYRHIRSVHLKEKRHFCQICSKAFSHSSDLKRHLTCVHGHFWSWLTLYVLNFSKGT